jgi:hypothetical protein
MENIFFIVFTLTGLCCKYITGLMELFTLIRIFLNYFKTMYISPISPSHENEGDDCLKSV